MTVVDGFDSDITLELKKFQLETSCFAVEKYWEVLAN